MTTFVVAFTLTCLFIVVYIYAGYPIVLALLNLIVGEKRVEKGEIEPAVTLLISCYNEVEVIKDKLENALALDYPREKLEIVFVSDGSTDGTDEVIKGCDDERVKLIRQEGRLGKTSGLNLAVPQSRGEIIVFSDANALYQKDAVKKLVRNFNDKSVGYVVGEALYKGTEGNIASESENTYWAYEIQLKKMESRLHSIVGGDGAIYSIRRELYEELDPKDINDFVNPLQIVAKGYRGVYEPEAVCYEEAAGSFEKEGRRKERIVNRSFRGLMRVKSVLNPWKTGFYSFEILSHKLLRWLTPFFLIGAIGGSIYLSYLNCLFFEILLMGEALFFWFAMIGYFFAPHYKISPLFYFPYYFLMINLSSMVGVIQAIRGNIQVTWVSARQRSEEDRFGPFRRASLAVFFLLLSYYLFWDALGKVMNIPWLGEKSIFWSSALVMVYVYAGYPLLLFLLTKKYHAPPIKKEPITPTVTLLVCAFNEEGVIAEKVANSLAIDYPTDKLRVVIASDGSEDGTVDIVRGFNDDRIVLYDYKERCGKIGVINKTVPKLDSEIIVFSDANTIYREDAIKTIVRNFADPQVGAVSSDVILKSKDVRYGESESTYYKYERWLQKTESRFSSMIGADGGMYALRRPLFQAPSGNIILDDFVISMNVVNQGKRLIYDEEAVAHEESDDSWQEEFRRKSRVIAGAIQALKQNEGIPSIKSSRVFFSFFSHKLLRWFVPLFMVALFVINIFLLAFDGGTLYKITMAIQILGYLSAWAGLFLEHSPCKIVFYFCLVNGAALYGIYKGLFNKQPVRWATFRGNEKKV